MDGNDTDGSAENALLQKNRDLLMLRACTRELVRLGSEPELLTSICRLIVDVGGYGLAWVGFAENDARQTVRVAASAGADASYLSEILITWDTAPTGCGPTGRAIRERRSVVCSDIEHDPAFHPWRSMAAAHGYSTSIALPLISSSGAVGALTIYSTRKGVFDASEQELLTDLADDLAYGISALRRQRDHELAERQIKHLSRVLRMQSGINSAVLRIRDADELLQEVCRVATHLGGYDLATLWIVNDTQRQACRLFSAGATGDFPQSRPLELSDGTESDTSLTSRALRTGELTVCNDLRKSEPPVAYRDEFLRLGYASVVALPLIVGGRRLGALTLASRDTSLLTDQELILLQEISATVAFALEYREEADAAERLTSFDPLTGLAKRKLFCERLDGLMRGRRLPGGALTIAAFDIRGLASLNDSFGRRVGDMLLQQVAERLRTIAVNPARIGRLGGGSFVLAEFQQGASAENIAELLNSAVFADSFLVEGQAIRIAYTLGLAHQSDDFPSVEALVQNAEAALKQAKDTGEQYLHYHLEMHSEIAERLDLEHRLRTALDEEQFVLHYQPQVNTETGRVESVEALLRWAEPNNGVILPGRFLPVLESSGMIISVGRWVLQHVLEDCRRWHSLGLRPLRVAVNVSAQQVRRHAFAAEILRINSGLNELGYGLDIEITESSLLQDLEATTSKLEELRAAGVRIALDDFGTGYSSLGLLSKLPVDLLKIDRSFISGLPLDTGSAALTSSIIQLGSAFGLATVAEGVETREQLMRLKQMRCTRVQGHVYSRPVPPDQIEHLLRQGIKLAPIPESIEPEPSALHGVQLSLLARASL